MKVLWVLLNRLVTVVWVTALTLLILAALYVGLGRQVMANLHHFEPGIETALTRAIGRPVHLSGLSGDWQGLDPVLRVGEVAVGERTSADTSLGHLKVRLDSWASLVRLRLVFREFRASGAEATLVQQPDGQFAVAGLWQPTPGSEELTGPADAASEAQDALDGQLGEWIDQAGRLLSNPVVTLTDLQLRVEPASGESLSLTVPAMDVRFEDGLFSAGGYMLRDGGERRRIGAFALEGRHLLSSGFTGDLFLDLEATGFFSDLLMPYEWRNLSVAALNAGAEAWLTFERAELRRARMTLDLSDVGLTSPVAQVTRLSGLSADLLWRRTEAGWILEARGSPFRWQGAKAGGFSGRVERDSDGLRVAARGLDLGAVSSMAHRSGLLPTEAQERLAAHDPSGRMERLEVTVPDDGDWGLRGTFRNMAVAAVEGAPSGSGLDGYLETGPREGRVTLENGPARIGFPELFHTDWRFQKLAGRVHWARRSDGWEVAARRLVGEHEGMQASGGFRLRLHEGSSDTLSLRVGIAGGRTSMLGRFVPRKRVPPELYSFLTEAVGSGTVTRGWYYGHGDIGGDDSDEAAGNRAFTSSMAYRFRETELTYNPEWPTLESAAGRVQVQGDEGHIQLDEGVVGGVELEPSQVRVTGNRGEGLRVDVDTGARREGELLTEQWRSSPLADIAGGWLADLRVTGSSHVDLSLSLWPDQARDPKVGIGFSLAEGHVRFAPAELEWRDVNGPIRFSTDDGFGNTDLDARFMGEPVTLQLRDGPEQAPVFRQQGRVSVARLERWLGRGLPRVAGGLDYTAAFRPTEGPTLRLDASLADLVLDWPAPFSKAAGEDHSLTTQVDFGGADAVRIEGDWQPLGAFQLVIRDGALERGRVGLGVRRTELPDEPVLSLVGNLPGADLEQWWQALEAIPAAEAASVDQEGASQGPGLPPLRVGLGIGEPRFRDWTLSPVRVQGEADLKGDWRVQLDSDWISGTLGNGEERALSVDLEHLVLPGSGPNGDKGTELDSGTLTSGARDWPEASIRIGRLVFGERRVTDLSLVLLPDGSRIRIDPLAFTMGDLALDGSLTWQPTVDSGVTEFSGTLNGRDLKGLETLIGRTMVPISSERTEASLNMAWPGGPMDLSLSGLRAAMDFRLEDGIIDQDIEGARVFRVFGLLNTDTLWRRLQLDFSDVYESGIPFDHIEGEVLIHEGRLMFDPAVSIQAPSGGFRMSGEADLISEALDMRLVVVLPVTQNLPLAAVLFGYAPPIGGALFVLDKVFGGILSRVTSATYTVEGTWSDPEVELRNLFDTESDLESYERPEVGVEAPERPAGEIRR